MARIDNPSVRALVVGSSMAGMAGAIALAREGLDVTVLEADPTPLPPEVAP